MPRQNFNVKRALLTLALLALLLMLYLLTWPVPVKPVAWVAPPNPGYSGAFAANSRLAAFEPVALGGEHGPEAIAIDADGRLYVATESGVIVQLAPDGTDPQPWANTGGRPLGMAFAGNGRLYAADAQLGLLEVAPGGDWRVVANQVDGIPIGLADDVDVADDGRVYFSDASTRFPAAAGGTLDSSLLEIFEHRGSGRLLRHDPATGLTTTLLDGLVFPNGVAMAHDQRSVLVTETGSYRVLRLWLDGEQRGDVETLIDALPGFPDNITRGRDGRYWIALVSPRDAALDALAGWPFLRAMLLRLPAAWRPAPVNYAHVIAIDDDGNVLLSLQDPAGGFPMLTSALETPGFLYLGSLVAPTAARVAFRP